MSTPDSPPELPIRLNKYLAQQGIATRRDADVLIASRKVLVNGEIALLGQKVTPDDIVIISRKARIRKDYIYLAFNKPRGIISHSAQNGEEDIVSALPQEFHEKGIFPVGRLDKDSYGLIILTNDGRITDRLLNPDRAHEKEYTVRTKLPLRPSFKEHMEAGVDIEGYQTKPTRLRIAGEHTFSITLTEGKKHQIRRMVVAMHNEVVELKRTRILNVRLGTLKTGQARPLEGDELTTFLSLLSLTK